MRDIGLVKLDEPFQRLLCQGMVLKDGAKMSKSLGNVVDPEEIINKYNADTARIFILFTALPEKELEWSDEGVQGSFRFLNKVHELTERNLNYIDMRPVKKTKLINGFLMGSCHRTITEVTEYLERFEFNLALSRVMGFADALYKYREFVKDSESKKVFGEGIKNLILLLSPFAPHLAEELWSKVGKKNFVSTEKWPEYDKRFISEELYMKEKLLKTVLEDVEEIKKLSKIEPASIQIFIAAPWKYKAYDMARESKEKLIERAMRIEEIKKNGDIAVKYLRYLMKEFEFPEILTREKELSSFKELKKFLEKETKCKITIADEQKSDKVKAKQARPMKPALYLE
jgi:leucyl-tRNA synthetase